MDVVVVLLFLAGVCVLVAVVSAVLLTNALDRRGLKTSFLFMRLLIFTNLTRYKKITVSENGKVGPLFYGYVVSINAAWILAIAAWAVHALAR